MLVNLRDQINAEPAEFMGVAATTVDGLFDRLDKLRQLAAELARQAAREKDPARLDRLQANLRRATENGEIVGTYVRGGC